MFYIHQQTNGVPQLVVYSCECLKYPLIDIIILLSFIMLRTIFSTKQMKIEDITPQLLGPLFFEWLDSKNRMSEVNPTHGFNYYILAPHPSLYSLLFLCFDEKINYKMVKMATQQIPIDIN